MMFSKLTRSKSFCCSIALLGAMALPNSPAQAQDSTSADIVATAILPENIRLAKDFKVELLYNVPKDKQGSWVSICTDPKGRLIVSDQYGGLFRITPPAIGAPAADTKIEPLNIKIGQAQGLLYAFDSLYVMVSEEVFQGRGLYRVRDTDGDDQFDKVELLRKLVDGGEHGPHSIVLAPDGKSIYCVIGNQTHLTELSGSRVPQIWSEDHLLPRMPDGRGFMSTVLGPGGSIYQVDPEGKNWNLLATGFRNEFDAAFNRNGDLFSYDADMEYDWNTSWYRPTRVCLVASGVDFGWRNGTGKWPVHYADTIPPMIDIGPGSPTGVTFGYGAKFPAKYQDALFICDWSYGKLYALHLSPDGAGYKAEKETFATGSPLPLTDMVVNPADGALYFMVGGRKTQSGLYRITYTGSESTEQRMVKIAVPEAQQKRQQLEAFHGKQDPAAVEAAWPSLSDEDRLVRSAARIALEHQPAAQWQEKALAEKNPVASITSMLALARVSARDEFHRKATDAPVDPALQGKILASLNAVDWDKLNETQQLELLRAYDLTFTRLDRPKDEAAVKAVADRLDAHFPAATRPLNAMLAELLIYLQAPSAAEKTMALLAKAPTQEEQIEYAKSLRMLKVGWTMDQRRQYMEWFQKSGGFRGGRSFEAFIINIKNVAVANMPDDVRAELKAVIEAKPIVQTPQETLAAVLKGRTTVKDWTVDDLTPALAKVSKGRNFERGRQMFGAVGCFACHRFANDGGAVGPDLTSIGGRFSARDLLESIILPNKEISDQYGQITVVLTKGDPVVGRIVNMSGESFDVATNMFEPNTMTRIDRKLVKAVQPSKLSPMPSGLLNLLQEDEILDLLAYLITSGDKDNAAFAAGK